MADTAAQGQQKEAAQLDSVTDSVVQTELNNADTSKIKVAMANLAAEQQAAKLEALRIEKELSLVKVSEEDIKIIASEFDMTTKRAERALKQCKGDLKATIVHLIQEERTY